MSRYPSSADLAAFRRAIHGTTLDTMDTSRCTIGPSCEYGDPHARAWDCELRNGIGYRIAPLPSPGWREDPHASRHASARREASAMRSRAYARMVTEQDGSDARPWLPITFIPPIIPMSWPEERHNGAPYTWRDTTWMRRVPSSEPTYIVPDYWDDDEPRTPLPVTYHNPVTLHAEA